MYIFSIQTDGGDHERTYFQEARYCRLCCRSPQAQGLLPDEIDRLIDWKPIEKVLRQMLKRVVNAVGNPAYGFFRARYLGLAKVELEFLLNAMAFNLKKAVLRVAC